jgi:predicted DNA-binding transcriptional regulator AlpA
VSVTLKISPQTLDHIHIDRMIKSREVAFLLQINEQSVTKGLSGERPFPLPPAVRLGRHWRFRLSDVTKFIAQLGEPVGDVTKFVAQQREPVGEPVELVHPNFVNQRKKRGRPANQPRVAGGAE